MLLQSNVLWGKNSNDTYYLINPENGVKYELALAGKKCYVYPDTITQSDIIRAKSDEVDIECFIDKDPNEKECQEYKEFIVKFILTPAFPVDIEEVI